MAVNHQNLIPDFATLSIEKVFVKHFDIHLVSKTKIKDQGRYNSYNLSETRIIQDSWQG